MHIDIQMDLLRMSNIPITSRERQSERNTNQTQRTEQKMAECVCLTYNTLHLLMHLEKKEELRSEEEENGKRRHQGRWNTITTWRILLYYSTHLNAEPLGVATP